MLSEIEAVLHAHLSAAEDDRDRYRAALIGAREALHRACLQIGSTEGYRADFDAINTALDDEQRTSPPTAPAPPSPADRS